MYIIVTLWNWAEYYPIVGCDRVISYLTDVLKYMSEWSCLVVFLTVYTLFWFWLKTTLDKLVTMATTKCLSQLCETQILLIHSCEKLPSFKAIVCSVLKFWGIYWAGSRKYPPPPTPVLIGITLSYLGFFYTQDLYSYFACFFTLEA